MIDEPNKLAEDTSLADQPEAGDDVAAPTVESDASAISSGASLLESTEEPETNSGSSSDRSADHDLEQVADAESGSDSPTIKSDAIKSEAVETEAEETPASEVTDPKPAAAETPVLESTVSKSTGPIPGSEPEEAEEPITMDWYILKVQSNREKSISEALERRVKIEGLEEHFDQIVVPTEKVTEFKGGKKRVVNRKLYPGYIIVRMHINDDTWFVVRETPGIGDFTGSGGKPTPMLPHEVQRIIVTEETETEEAPKLKIGFLVGDRVKINEGTFESFEGEVSKVDQASGQITVLINIFGRSTPVELEYWQAESI